MRPERLGHDGDAPSLAGLADEPIGPSFHDQGPVDCGDAVDGAHGEAAYLELANTTLSLHDDLDPGERRQRLGGFAGERDLRVLHRRDQHDA